MRRTLEDIIPPSRRRAADTAGRSKDMLSQKPAPQRSSRNRFAYKPALVALVVIAVAIGILFFAFRFTN